MHSPLDNSRVRAWIETELGIPLDALDAARITVCASEKRKGSGSPLWAIRTAQGSIVTARPAWVDALRPVVDGLTADMLFTTFGACELSRVTLPHGFGVWGPSWYLFADAHSFCPVEDPRPVPLDPEEMSAMVNFEVFWHCFPRKAARGFAVQRDGALVAVSAVRDTGRNVWEVGVDVAPGAGGQGLGRAVLSAAGRWILERDGLILGITAPWNIPSARMLRGAGLEFCFVDMVAVPAPFRVPPQPLGQPLPGAKLRNYYPGWAMNQDILPQENR